MAGGFPCILEEANALGISGHVGPRSAHRWRNRCGAGLPYHLPLLPLPLPLSTGARKHSVIRGFTWSNTWAKPLGLAAPY